MGKKSNEVGSKPSRLLTRVDFFSRMFDMNSATFSVAVLCARTFEFLPFWEWRQVHSGTNWFVEKIQFT